MAFTIGDVASRVLELGREVTQTIGLPGMGKLIPVAQEVVKLVDTTLDTFHERDQAKLRAMRDSLARKTAALAEQTAKNLEG